MSRCCCARGEKTSHTAYTSRPACPSLMPWARPMARSRRVCSWPARANVSMAARRPVRWRANTRARCVKPWASPVSSSPRIRPSPMSRGVLNVVHGYGIEAGEPLVTHPDVTVISFTGSTAVGRRIATLAGQRLAKVSQELGGKNPLLVCDDADLDLAVKWTLLSAFSNAGQRCAAASRVIVFDAIYDRFRERLLAGVNTLRVGPGDEDDFGPVINERQLNNMIGAVARAAQRGAAGSAGGGRLQDPQHRQGYYMAPTVIEGVGQDDEISTTEIFGPITCLYRARDFRDALAQANASPYALTACIHTKNIHRALEFTHKVQACVAVVNGSTYGSEPHMPFGGAKNSGNGSREPGTEALDVYSQIKDIYLNVDTTQL